jgi:hypothetical protein
MNMRMTTGLQSRQPTAIKVDSCWAILL